MTLYQLDNQNCRIRVDAARGARITEFSLQSKNCLFTGLPEWGSTFWPSPQHAWGWPPPADLDSGAYECVATADSLEFISTICRITQLQLSKKVVPSGQGFNLIYRLTNCSAVDQAFAPWEISRISGGLTFFASDELPLENSTLSLVHTQGCYWHEYQVETQSDNLKSFVNGSAGWLANANQGLLLLKQFAPIPQGRTAPLEAEIEIYAHGDRAQPYIEIEQQGIYATLKPGESLEWQVHWSLFAIPSNIEVTLGSQFLLQWVKELLIQS